MRLGVLPQENQAGDRAQAKPSDGTAAQTKKTNDGRPGAARVFAPRFPPQSGTFKEHEVLAGNLSPLVRERLRGLGYRVSDASAPGPAVIALPKNLFAWETMRALEAEYSRQGFGLNYYYEAYSGTFHYVLDDAPIEAEVPVNGSVGCRTERCYGRKVIGWEDQLSACAKGVKIGIIDTGFDDRHPAFEKLKVMGKPKPKYVMRTEDAAARAPASHGTAVLSLLAGAAVSSTPGLVPDADFLVADAFFSNAGGRPRTDTLHLLEALRRLEENGAQIINMSLVGPRDDLVHERIIAMSQQKGVVFVAAAGNGGKEALPGYPAAYEEVIAVTAVDRDGKSYRDANRGDYISVAAPGVRIWTALPGNKEGMVSGTSFAVPFVTAIAAASYNKSALKALLSARHLPLDPKGAMLAQFSIDKLGSGEREDREKYGLGLAKAPPNCGPKEQPWVAKVKPPPAAPQAWKTDTRRASLQ
jgi:subtilisin family serine protease